MSSFRFLNEKKAVRESLERLLESALKSYVSELSSYDVVYQTRERDAIMNYAWEAIKMLNTLDNTSFLSE